MFLGWVPLPALDGCQHGAPAVRLAIEEHRAGLGAVVVGASWAELMPWTTGGTTADSLYNRADITGCDHACCRVGRSAATAGQNRTKDL